MVDATVLFAGTVWRRWSHEVLRHALAGDLDLVLSPLVIEQTTHNLQEKFPEFAAPFESWLKQCSFELVADPSQEEREANRSLVRQIEDVPIGLSAIAAGVDYFVSEDKDFTERSKTTQAIHARLTIMRPVIFLREVMGWSSEELEKVRRRSWSSTQ